MCQYYFTTHSCGHTLPRVEEPYNPTCRLCVPVLVALRYYHDQPTQVCVEGSFQQVPMRMPTPCPPIFPEPLNTTGDGPQILAQEKLAFDRIMEGLGVGKAEMAEVEQLAKREDVTSKRATNGPLSYVSPQRVLFLVELEKWQQRLLQSPNITFNTVTWGCGGTGPGLQPDCLHAWTGRDILMLRHGVWNKEPPRPVWVPSDNSTPPVGWLKVHYGQAPVLALPERWRASAVRTAIDIPMYSCLLAVLRELPPGRMVVDEDGYLVSDMGASGWEIGVGPSHRPPILPRLPISSAHNAPLRPHQILAPHTQQPPPLGRLPQVPATEASIAPNPGETRGPFVRRVLDIKHSTKEGEAGSSQPIHRADIGSKIKELPQRRASRSGATTPAVGTLSTRATSPAAELSRHTNSPIGLGIIDEILQPAASSNRTGDEVEGKS